MEPTSSPAASASPSVPMAKYGPRSPKMIQPITMANKTLAIPAAIATGAPLPIVIGAVLSGGLFGDHSSPVSETTILSSTGAGTTTIEHFRTQLPYALTNGAIALAGFIVAGFAHLTWIAIVAVVCQFLVIWMLIPPSS